MSDVSSLRPKWSQEQVDAAIRRATKILKDNHDPVNPASVARRATSYCNAPKATIEKFLLGLSLEKRIALGFPDPNAKKEPPKVPICRSVPTRKYL